MNGEHRDTATGAGPEGQAQGGLEGRTALVTGASGAIGRACAVALADRGARIVVAYGSDEQGAQETADLVKAAGAEPVVAQADLSDPGAARALVAAAGDAGVDILVNNAAASPHFGPLLDASEAQWDKTFEVNVKGYVHTIKACVPLMRERGGGRIIKVASVAAMVPHSGLGVYGVTKAAVVMLTRTLAVELAPDIRVNAIAPGLIETKFSEVLWSSPEMREKALRSIPQHRIGQTDDLVGAALYLASDASAFTTGAVMVVDGGQTLGGAY